MQNILPVKRVFTLNSSGNVIVTPQPNLIMTPQVVRPNVIVSQQPVRPVLEIKPDPVKNDSLAEQLMQLAKDHSGGKRNVTLVVHPVQTSTTAVTSTVMTQKNSPQKTEENKLVFIYTPKSSSATPNVNPPTEVSDSKLETATLLASLAQHAAQKEAIGNATSDHASMALDPSQQPNDNKDICKALMDHVSSNANSVKNVSRSLYG